MVSQSSLALDRSFSIEKPSISNGLMRILSEIFFSSSSCSFVLLRSSCADVRLPYIRRDKSINNGWPAYICVFGSAFHPVLWIRTAKSFLVMVKLGPFLLACSFIACIIAWRFFSDSSRRLDKKIGFFFYISNVAYIIYISEIHKVGYGKRTFSFPPYHVASSPLQAERETSGGGLSRKSIKKSKRWNELTDFTLATLLLLLLFLGQSFLLVRASDLALRLLLLRTYVRRRERRNIGTYRNR